MNQVVHQRSLLVRVVATVPRVGAGTRNGWTQEYFRAECEEATLELNERNLRIIRNGPWEPPTTEDLPLLEQEVWMNPWLAELFCDWVNGGPAPQNTLEDNIQCAALLFAAVESAHTGKTVDVQELLKKHMSK